MSSWRRFSRLPESPEYWEGVTGRVQQSLHAMADESMETQRSLMPLAWTAIAATLIAVLASRALPQDAGTPLSLESGLAPADSIGVAWIEQSRPPSVVEMLMTRAGGPQ